MAEERMAWSGEFITKADLGIAYRKAKADLFYEREHPNAFALCEYEQNLHKNLSALFDRLTSGDLAWMKEPEFLGGWALIPKSLDVKPTAEGSWRPSDPDEAWKALAGQRPPESHSKSDKPIAAFRVVGVHSIEFHVVSALWMFKVGHFYDSVLTRDAYAYRLRRIRSRKTDPDSEQVETPNLDSLGSFPRYVRPFGKWRDNGLRTMRESLRQGKPIVAITTDVRQFFHSISPDFLLDEQYLGAVGLTRRLGQNEREFTGAIVDSLLSWTARTPVSRGSRRIGLPVGLPAARLIANVSLAEFDIAIRKEVVPLYYGRYVDDIILVFENTRRFQNEIEVWKFICERVPHLDLKIDGEIEVRFTPPYLRNSEIVLAGTKQKVFSLEGDSGSTLVESIEHQILERASEWRALPERPVDPNALQADLVSAWGKDGEEVDNLRKADALSLRRAAVAIRLRDMEAFEQDLRCDDWKIQRQIFLKTMKDHLLALPHFFSFSNYFPRIFALAIACKEYDLAVDLIQRLTKVIDLVQKDCTPSIVGSKRRVEGDRIIRIWRYHLVRALSEALAAALRPHQESQRSAIGNVLQQLNRLSDRREVLLPTSEDAIGWARHLFQRDMGSIAFRTIYFENAFGRIEPKAWPSSATDGARLPTVAPNSPFEEKQLLDSLRSFLKSIEEEHHAVPMALAYPTRPFRTDEIYLLVPDLLHKAKARIRRWAKAFRGFSLRRQLPGSTDGDGTIVIPFAKPLSVRRVAVTSWETSEASWTAAVTAQADPDGSRYQRLSRLMNAVLAVAAEKRPDYVVLHELSLPWRWFRRTASKLQELGISLIAGIEYLPVVPNKTVANEVWASLVGDFIGKAIVYRQRKASPALHEELDLKRIGGLELATDQNTGKPILRHGAFQFGILVCSELTNVDYRLKLRGNVDAVFVPEWNKDTETFSYLMEASALDIHAFMIQCNNRIHGDSRIRVPSANSWKRDIVRVKGGIDDYFVIGEINVMNLRAFQSNYRSPINGEFKPVPDGFKMDPGRRTLPT